MDKLVTVTFRTDADNPEAVVKQLADYAPPSVLAVPAQYARVSDITFVSSEDAAVEAEPAVA